MAARYRIADEPRPNILTRLVVEPTWPLFAMMFAGPWLSLPWFVLNSFALGSPTRSRELVLAATTLLGSVALIITLGYCQQIGWLDQREMRYAALSLVALRLGCAYALCISQSNVCELFRYYGGTVNNGMIFLVLAVAVVTPLVKSSLSHSWLQLVLI